MLIFPVMFDENMLSNQNKIKKRWFDSPTISQRNSGTNALPSLTYDAGCQNMCSFLFPYTFTISI